MREISLFVDESGELGTESRRYLVCLASTERYMLLQLADFLSCLELTRI